MISQAIKHWNALEGFRFERNRCKNYTYGRQWDDYVTVDGHRMKEEDYIRSQGNIPLKNNLIRRMVRNVLGLYRNYYKLPGLDDLGLEETPENLLLYSKLQRSARENSLTEIYSRTMEEFLISGMAVHRKWIEKRNGEAVVRTRMVSPDSFFFNSDMRDPRGWDATAVGQIHDAAFDNLALSLGGTPAVRRMLLELYGDPEATCRVVEYWRREITGHWRCHDMISGRIFNTPDLPEGNDALRCRWVNEQHWNYYFLTPDGTVLKEGRSPYPHGGHPYVFKLYPFIDGEIHSFVADCIDQQRYVNRLVTLHDWIMRASAKGVLLFPENTLPEYADMDEIIDQWSRFNGVIVYRPKSGMPQPQQVSVNSTNIGISELLEVQLKMLEDVSGVNSAIQGKIESGAVSGTLFDMQTRQAMNGLVDILESFRSFVCDAALRDVGVLAKICES